jgi:methanogenic corrinoid protein MtbC1
MTELLDASGDAAVDAGARSAPASPDAAVRSARIAGRALAADARGCSGIRDAVEAEIVPRLVQSFRERTPPCSPAPACAAFPPADVGAFAEVLMRGDPAAAMAFLAARRDGGASLETLYIELMGPAACLLGDMWTEDRCSFADVTIGLGALRGILRELSPEFLDGAERRDPRRRALLVQVPGEQHSLGLHMAAEFFRRAGWEVAAETPQTREDLADLVRDEWYGVVGISAGSDAQFAEVASCIRAVRQASRNRGVGVLVGGPAFVCQPGHAALVGADAAATDGRQAPVQAERLLTQSPPRR